VRPLLSAVMAVVRCEKIDLCPRQVAEKRLIGHMVVICPRCRASSGGRCNTFLQVYLQGLESSRKRSFDQVELPLESTPEKDVGLSLRS
jgi:hypothetical protein